MRTEQYRLYKVSMRSMNMVLDVLPFYLTWFILTIVFLKEDVSIAFDKYSDVLPSWPSPWPV